MYIRMNINTVKFIQHASRHSDESEKNTPAKWWSTMEAATVTFREPVPAPY
jgi:hypothetical protein